MFRRISLTCTIVVIFGTLFLGSVEAADKPIVLRIGLIAADEHPVTKASKRFEELVEERSGGAFDVQVFPGGTLGGEHEMQDMVSTGALEMLSIGTGITAGPAPQFKILQMPYLWESQDQMIAFTTSEIAAEMDEAYRQQTGIKVLASNWDQGIRHTLTKKPVKSLDDLQGIKIRVPQLPEWVEMWKLAGANPVQIPFPEVYTALQQGVVDAMESPLYWIYSTSFYEQAKNIILTGHVMYYNQLSINDALFSSFSAEQQQILLDAAKEAGEYETELTRAIDADLQAKLEAEGVVFTEIDRAEMAKKVRPVFESWKDVFGAELLEKVDRFKAEYK